MKSIVRLPIRNLSSISGDSAASQLDKVTGKAQATGGSSLAGFRRGLRRLPAAVALFAALGLGFATHATAQAATFLNWTTQVGGSAIDGAEAVALDGSGNIYAITFNPAGTKTIAVKIPASDPTCSTPSDCTQIATNFTWALPYGGTESPQYIAVDGSGDVFLSSGVQLIEVPATDLTCSHAGDCIQLAGSNPAASYISVDGSGNLYALEYLPNAGEYEVVKYTPSGNNTYTSRTLFTVPSGTNMRNMAVDAGDDVYLIDTTTTDAVYDNLVEYPVSSSYTPVTIVSYTTIGFMVGVTLDSSGNIYVVNGAGAMYKLSKLVDSPLTPSGSNYAQSLYGIGVGVVLAADASGDVYDATGNAGDSLFEIHSGSVNFGSVEVGATSPLVQLNYSMGTTASVSGPSPVLTQGATGQDFAASSLTFPGVNEEVYPCSSICYAYVNFTPKKAGERQGAEGLLLSGATIANAYLQGIGVAPQAVIYPGTETTLFNAAANGLSTPTGLAVDGSGNVYIADTVNGRVLKETLSGGSYTQSVVANGLSYPAGMAVDGAGYLYVGQQVPNIVQQLTPSSGGYTVCCTVASAGTSGLSEPSSVAVDGAGNVYIADTGNKRVVMETLSGGFYNQSIVVSELQSPSGVAVDGSGNVYIADSGNNAVYKETLTGETLLGGVYTQSVIGSGMFAPESVAVDGAGDVYVADTFNNRILLEAYSNGVYTQSVLLSSGLSFPEGVALDGNGNLYIADSSNNRVLKLDVADPQTFTFAATPKGATSSDSPQTAILLNIGNATLAIPNPSTGTNPSVSANFAVGNAAGDCSVVTPNSFFPGSLAAGASCLVPISFEPATTGALSGSLVFTDNNLNGTSATNPINLSGTGFTPVATTTALGSSLTPSAFGQSVTFTATVAQNSGGTVPTGTVQFSVDGSTAGSPVTLSGGQANYATSSLAVGTHSVTAVYTPTSGTAFITSSATALSQVVNRATPTVTVTPATSSITTAQSLSVTVTVTGDSAYSMPGEVVTLSSGSYTSAIATLSAGNATIVIPAGSLATGSDTLTVNYSGDSNYTSASNTASVTVTPAPPPFGNLEEAEDSATGSTTVSQADSVLVGGWVADQTDGAPLSNVKVYIDGALVGTPTLGLVRSDVAAAFHNAAYTDSGYQLLHSAATLSVGPHAVTVVAIDSGGRSTTFGPLTITVTAGASLPPPFGNLEEAEDSATGSTTVSQADSVLVGGWVADQTDGAPLSNVKVYIDGALVGTPTLGLVRSDVAAAFHNAAYTDSGYQLLHSAATLSVGPHAVTVVAIDSGGRSTTFGPLTITVTAGASLPPPFGNLEEAEDSATGSTTVSQADSLLVGGWVADQTDGAPLSNVKVYIDGTLVGTPTLGLVRSDVAAAFHNAAYTDSGYQLLHSAATLSVGPHAVTVVAIDSGGRSTTFGPLTITVTAGASLPPPFGNLEEAEDSATGSTTVSQADSVLVGGWVADQTDGAPLSNVKVYIDGTLVGTPTLGLVRSDVAAAFHNAAYTDSGYQLLHSAATLSVGPHVVTVVAIDSGGRSTTFGPLTIAVQ